ncbi:MAG: outer membrane beta-barrel protein [Paludibacter sp.]|nr:outer membrane beta-barrel protein [Paludibacter sp.]
MKAKFFLLLLFFGIILQLTAQEEGTTKKTYIKFGPKVGLDLNTNLSDLPSGSQLSEELKGNYQFGGFLQFGKRLYFQPEFMYAVINTTNEQNEKVALEYYKVPVHIGVKFFDIGLLSLHVSGGAVYTHKGGDAFSFDKEKINYQIGAGVDVFDFITTDLRYTLKKDVSLADQINDFTTKGGTINITVGLKL